jgi:predicted DNA-binding transcriptional regulator AlpA
MSTESLPTDVYGPTREALALLPICRRTLFEWTRRGLIPQPVRLSSRKLIWNLSALRRHLAERQAQPAPAGEAHGAA